MKTLDTLAIQSFSSKAYEIIIIDNGSIDDTPEVIESFKKKFPEHHIKNFFDKTPGLLTGRHLGAKSAQGEILTFVDDDIQASENWLSTIHRVFENPEIHMAGGKCLPNYEVEPPKWVQDMYLKKKDSFTLADLSLCDYGDQPREVSADEIWGLNLSIRRKTLYEVGGFNPDNINPHYQAFQGDGESGLAYKIMSRKLKSYYHPDIFVLHDVPKARMTLEYFDRRYFYQGICDSYTRIRKTGSVEKPPEAPGLITQAKGMARTVRDAIRSRPVVDAVLPDYTSDDLLKIRFKAMKEAGFRFHQKAAQSKMVLDWVMRPDYFDYTLPVMRQKP
jgi:glycosyltransferase involved in cell wall biosynthesis